MNVLLFAPENRLADNGLEIAAYQHQHLLNILKLKQGDHLRVAEENGNLGYARVELLNKEDCKLTLLSLDEPPPPQSTLSLIVALPRPQMIKRILQNIACMGVKALYLLQTSRVEKSFWQSPVLESEEIHRQLKLGLEQAGATQFPDIHFVPRFIPFVEDQLRPLIQGRQCFIAEPGEHRRLNQIDTQNESLIAIGPEGGFIGKEIKTFKEAGFEALTLGRRILKVETAVTCIAGHFLPI